MMERRCDWANSSEILKQYHDLEWGKPVYEDKKLFEMLILEGKSCGLSWELILKKRDHMRIVFDHFDPEILAQYDHKKIEALMQDTGIIRSRLKIDAAIANAKAYLRLIQKESFRSFLWKYVDGKPIINDGKQWITQSEISKKLSKDLKRLGFKFVGATIIYSFMQAVGMINDHQEGCAWR